MTTQVPEIDIDQMVRDAMKQVAMENVSEKHRLGYEETKRMVATYETMLKQSVHGMIECYDKLCEVQCMADEAKMDAWRLSRESLASLLRFGSIPLTSSVQASSMVTEAAVLDAKAKASAKMAEDCIQLVSRSKILCEDQSKYTMDLALLHVQWLKNKEWWEANGFKSV